MARREPPVLTRDAVAELLGLTPKSISTYLTESRETVGVGAKARRGRYADHPFPAPDDYIGRGPWWHPARKDELLKWAASRPGQGAGGGRPANKH